MADFFELIAKKKPIYITNHGEGTVILELERPGKSKKPYSRKIPKITKHPIPLHKIIPWPILEHDSDTIFDWIKSGVFRLWDPAKAEARSKRDPDMEATILEVIQTANQQNRYVAPKANLKVSDGALEYARTAVGKENTEDLGLSESLEREEGEEEVYVKVDGSSGISLSTKPSEVAPKIVMMVNSLTEDKTLVKEVLMEFKLMDDDLMTEDALGFIIKKTRKFNPIQKWAKGALADLKNAVDDEDDDEEYE